jgi:hypothetical protein
VTDFCWANAPQKQVLTAANSAKQRLIMFWGKGGEMNSR